MYYYRWCVDTFTRFAHTIDSVAFAADAEVTAGESKSTERRKKVKLAFRTTISCDDCDNAEQVYPVPVRTQFSRNVYVSVNRRFWILSQISPNSWCEFVDFVVTLCVCCRRRILIYNFNLISGESHLWRIWFDLLVFTLWLEMYYYGNSMGSTLPLCDVCNEKCEAFR